jgi:hypothetical protein
MVSSLDPDSSDEGLILRGSIDETSVPELLRSVLSSGETGVLTFTRGAVTKSVYLHLGKVVYARSSDPDERLGEDLLMRGKITARQYLEASKLIRPGRRLGVLLVELGALDSEDLLSSLEHHVKAILLDVFTWRQGEYELVMSDPERDDVITLNLNMDNLILEGIRRIQSWSQIYRGIGGDIEAIPEPTGNTETLMRLELSEEEQEVLAHVNGRATIEQICQVSYLTNIETCRILWVLQVLGVIRRGFRAESAQVTARLDQREQEMDLEAVVEKYNQMLFRVHSFLRGRAGEEADTFLAEALVRVSARYETLFYGIDLRQYGRADYDQMLANVADLPPAERRKLMKAGLDELVNAILQGVRARHGAQEEAVVSGIIKDGFRRLGRA